MCVRDAAECMLLTPPLPGLKSPILLTRNGQGATFNVVAKLTHCLTLQATLHHNVAALYFGMRYSAYIWPASIPFTW